MKLKQDRDSFVRVAAAQAWNEFKKIGFKIKNLEELIPKNRNLNLENTEEEPEAEPELEPIGELPLIDIEVPTFTSKMYIPKVRFPKIKISIPNVYKKNKEEVKG